MEAPPSRQEGTYWHGNGEDAAADDDSSWCDASDSPGHGSSLHTEWAHLQDRLHNMGYREGITEGRKDAAQEGFNLGHRQSAPEGYKWGLVRGITSALASLPGSLKEKLLLDAQCRGKVEDLRNSVQEISPEAALRMFHESIIQDNAPLVESRLQTIPNDLPRCSSS
ncbi:uncharacterized protein LOC119273470 [Triticum dicoccoides]|uniref:uncharacterized protein LOC119273470 n=1 Tax=Triticum dicoccoides TaxID=85692 RepID=UPI0018909478|nr:uncharacterized protein LOC119273470 [Triticum dicoccoides]